LRITVRLRWGPFLVTTEWGDTLSHSYRPELEYLKSVNRIEPRQDPHLLFVLMAEFANANDRAEGAAFLHQNTDPCKFILYSAKIRERVPQMGGRVGNEPSVPRQ
jgi:hypothetical protein